MFNYKYFSAYFAVARSRLDMMDTDTFYGKKIQHQFLGEAVSAFVPSSILQKQEELQIISLSIPFPLTLAFVKGNDQVFLSFSL